MTLQNIIVYLLFAGAVGYIGRMFYKSIFSHEKSDEICKECSQYAKKKTDLK